MYVAALATIGVLGLAFGSIVGTRLTGDVRYGLMVANFIAMMANIFKIQDNFAALFFGRLIFGLASGVAGQYMVKALDENIPTEWI